MLHRIPASQWLVGWCEVKSDAWFWGGILLISVVIRGSFMAWSMDSLDADPDAYRAMAATWHDTGTFGRFAEDGRVQASAYRPPFYPWILSWVSSGSKEVVDKTWIATLHVGLGALTCLTTALVGRRLGLPRVGCGMAGLLVAADPILLRQSVLVMTETTATLLGVLCWWLWVRTGPKGLLSGILLGVALGLAVLCRPTALAWIVLWGTWLAWIAWRRWAGREAAGPAEFRSKAAIGCVLGIAAMLTPWTLRNAREIGTPITTTTHGGYTLYLANNPILYAHWERSASREWPEDAFHARWREQRRASQEAGEVAKDRLAGRLAWHAILNDPLGFARGCGIRLGWFWAFWPSQRQASMGVQWAIGIWYGLVYVLAAMGAWRLLRSGQEGTSQDGSAGSTSPLRDRCLWGPGLLLVVSLMLVHCVYWSNMRMRAPAVPVLSLLACGAACSMGLRIRRSGGNPKDFLTLRGEALP